MSENALTNQSNDTKSEKKEEVVNIVCSGCHFLQKKKIRLIKEFFNQYEIRRLPI